MELLVACLLLDDPQIRVVKLNNVYVLFVY